MLRGPIAVAVYGTSTLFAFWGFHLVARVVETLAGGAHYIHGNTLEELREGWKARGDRSVVFSGDLPDLTLSHFLLANRLTAIAFVDDPRDAVFWAMASRNFDPENAIRFAARSFAAQAEPFTSDHVLVIRRWKARDVPTIIQAICEHLGALGTDSEIEEVLRRMEALGPGKGSVSLEENLMAHHGGVAQTRGLLELPEETKRLIERAVADYRPLFDGKKPSRISWPIELFYTPGEAPPFVPVDITGPARHLLFGPYMFLPRGGWTAHIVFEITENDSGCRALADVKIGDEVFGGTFTMPRTGVFSYTLAFEVKDPQRPIEVRVGMERGAIEGKILWRSATICAQGSTPPAEALMPPSE